MPHQTPLYDETIPASDLQLFRLASFRQKLTTCTSSWIHSQLHENEIKKQNCSDHPDKWWLYLYLLPEQHRTSTKPLPYKPCKELWKSYCLLQRLSVQTSVYYCRLQHSHLVRPRLLAQSTAHNGTEYIVIPAKIFVTASNNSHKISQNASRTKELHTHLESNPSCI